MRELEFLPAWYPQLRRRKRWVVGQAWLTLTVAAGLTLWVVLIQGNIARGERDLADAAEQLTRRRGRLRQMHELDSQRAALRQQEQILDRLGLHVQSTRLLRSIDSAMPREMALTTVQLEAEEHVAAAPANRLLAAGSDAPADRRLRVKIQGVAPTGTDLADFVARLGTVPFFDQVAITYDKERGEGGRTMREFEVTFSLDLNTPAGG